MKGDAGTVTGRVWQWWWSGHSWDKCGWQVTVPAVPLWGYSKQVRERVLVWTPENCRHTIA